MDHDGELVSIQDLALPHLVLRRRAVMLLPLSEVRYARDDVHCGHVPAILHAVQMHDPGCDFDYSPLPP